MIQIFQTFYQLVDRHIKTVFKNISVGYISGGNFTQVGYASYTQPVNDNVELLFSWNSPVANVSALQFNVSTYFGSSATTQSTFSSVVSVPTISIISPIENDQISLNSSTVLSAQATYSVYPVSSVGFYLINDQETIFVNSATSASGYWTTSITPSAISANGRYTLYASGRYK